MEVYTRRTKEEIAAMKRVIVYWILGGLFFSTFVLLITKEVIYCCLFFLGFLLLMGIYIYLKNKIKESERIRKIESVFPDFLELMASNLRSSMTIDRAFLYSARPEFEPLDKEIIKTSKEITTSKDIKKALEDFSNRIGSNKVEKTINLIITGIKAGGNIVSLLEQTASNMREKEFMEKKAYSNIFMFVVFIFLVVSFFAPALFALSNVLSEILIKILTSLPKNETANVIGFSLTKVEISTIFIKYFSIVFIIAIDFFASLILGLISKNEEKEGIKFFPIILILSLLTFLGAQYIINNFLKGLI